MKMYKVVRGNDWCSVVPIASHRCEGESDGTVERLLRHYVDCGRACGVDIEIRQVYDGEKIVPVVGDVKTFVCVFVR